MVAQQGELAIVVDAAAYQLKVTGKGFWSPDYVQAHIREFEAVLLQARQWPQPSRTLVDLRNSPVQSPEVAELLHSAMCRMYRPPERAAIIVSSSLVRMQMKRGFNPETHEVFTSEAEAKRWLDAA